jgi:hypothetical protein
MANATAQGLQKKMFLIKVSVTVMVMVLMAALKRIMAAFGLRISMKTGAHGCTTNDSQRMEIAVAPTVTILAPTHFVQMIAMKTT